MRGGVNGELFDVAREGEGERGTRPPAVRVEKIPAWDLTGVCTTAVAIVDFESRYREDLEDV